MTTHKQDEALHPTREILKLERNLPMIMKSQYRRSGVLLALSKLLLSTALLGAWCLWLTSQGRPDIHGTSGAALFAGLAAVYAAFANSRLAHLDDFNRYNYPTYVTMRSTHIAAGTIGLVMAVFGLAYDLSASQVYTLIVMFLILLTLVQFYLVATKRRTLREMKGRLKELRSGITGP